MIKITMEDLFNNIFSVSELIKKIELMSNELRDYFEQDYDSPTGKQLILAEFEIAKTKADILSDYLNTARQMIDGLMIHEKEFIPDK